MSLSRRTGARFQANIWPGFVDAMTGLLLVLTFALSIFMVVQFVLSETITGQETELDQLSGEVAALARALGVEERRNADLTDTLGTLQSTLDDRDAQLSQQQALIASLTQTRDRQAQELAQAAGRIASFEDQVAVLLSERNSARDLSQRLEGERDRLTDERDALNAALAQMRGEMDAQLETARLAAARREALEALVADLRAEAQGHDGRISALGDQVSDLTRELSEQEAQRLAEAEAAAALRKRLEEADTELTAITLALEAKRREAEETLTLLAAARAARDDLDARLAAALIGQTDKSDIEARANEATKRADALQIRVDELAINIALLEAALASSEKDREAQEAASAVTQDALQARINALEAQIATLETALTNTQEDRAILQTRAMDDAKQVQALEARLAAMMAKQAQNNSSQEEIRAQLLAALAAQKAAETQADSALSDVEARDILLAEARETLTKEQERASRAVRQTELLNQQIAQLRNQLGQLQSLLDDAKARDAAAQVELQNLGADLNQALARAAQEERKRRQLEEERSARLEEEKRRLEEEKLDLEQYRSDFFGRLRAIIGARDDIRIEGDRFVFSSEVLFEAGSADLSPDGLQEIGNVARILRRISRDIPAGIDWIIRVDGHTDNVPLIQGREFADNWELSQARALSVVREMIERHGIPPTRLSANGFGQWQPVAKGNSPEARAQNRRIELKLTER